MTTTGFEPLRILLVNKFLYVKGGAERAFFDYDAALLRRGHETIHFAMDHPDNQASPWSRYFVSPVAYDRPGASRHKLTAAARLFFSPEVRRQVSRLVREAAPDVAVLHNVYHQLGPALALELAARGVPMAMVLHDYKVTCPRYTRLRAGRVCCACGGGRFSMALRHRCGGSAARGALLAAAAYWEWRALRTYHRIERYIAPSRYLIGAVEEMGFPFPIELLRNPVAVPPTPADPTSGRALGFAGRLSAEKGLNLLLDAAAALPDIPLRIAGEGPLRASLERRIQSEGLRHVHLLGHLPHARLLGEIASWRGAVVPSVWPENCPYGVLEPMSLGIPVVGTLLGGLPELIRGRGLLVPPGDARALQTAMRTLWDDPSLAGDLGRRGREFVCEACSPNVFAERLEALLLGMLPSRGSATREERNT